MMWKILRVYTITMCVVGRPAFYSLLKMMANAHSCICVFYASHWLTYQIPIRPPIFIMTELQMS